MNNREKNNVGKLFWEADILFVKEYKNKDVTIDITSERCYIVFRKM